MNTNLTKYNSTAGLTSKTQETYYVFIYPIILGIGVILNSISLYTISTILKRKIKHSKYSSNEIMYKYMLVNQLADLLTCLNASLIILSRCGQYCSIAFTLPVKIYEQYIYTFMGNTYIFWSFLNEISFSIERLSAFSDTKRELNNRRISFKYHDCLTKRKYFKVKLS